MSVASTVTELTDLSYSQQERYRSNSDEDFTANSRTSNDGGTVADDQAPADAVEAIPDGGYGETIVFSCATLLFWMNGYNTTWGVLQTALLLSSTLKVDVRTITFVGSLSMVCLVAFGLASVRLMRTFGIRYTCAIAVVLYGFGPILTSSSLSNIGGLFGTAGVLVGLSSSILYTATNSMPIQWFRSKLGLTNGLVKAGGGVGATVLPIAAQSLIDSVGLPWTFSIFGFLMLATGIPAALMLKERASPATSSRFDWSLLKNIPFLALAMVDAISVFALFVPPFFLPLFASSIGLPASTGAALVAGFGGSTAIADA